MKNKSGQFFALYLVLLTLFMCGVVMVFYFVQIKDVEASFVSPKVILELEDKQEIFEMQEREFILNSAEKFKQDWGKDVFIDSFRNEFLKLLKGDEAVMGFLSENLTVNGVSASLGVNNEDDFFKNTLYPASSFSWNNEKDKLIIQRKEIGKSFKLMAGDRRGKIHFPVGVNYVYRGEYLLSYDGSKFKIDEDN